MYIFKNALTSIVRNKGRNLLIGIIIFVIAATVSIALAINNSSDSLIKSYEEKYETEATLGVNRNNLMQNFDPKENDSSKENIGEAFNEASSISIEDINNYAESSYVKSYYYTMSTGVLASDLEKAEISNFSKPDDNNDFRMEKREEFQNQSSGDFTLTGYSSYEAMSEFINGSYTIVEGEVSDDFEGNNCLINNELATLNELSVGDTITITDSVDETKTYDLTITGIYEEKTSLDNQMSMFSNSVNTILTNTTVLEKMQAADDELTVSTKPTFILTSKDVIEDFENELREKGLNEYLSVETNLDEMENATITISNVKTFAITFLIITLIIGTIVLLVINMINIRERKYEIGVLRTIGMKKSKVCLQFLCELFIVSLISLMVGAIVGASLSVPISNKLLQNEITSSTEEANDVRANFGKGSAPDDDGPNDNFANKNFNGIVTINAFDSIDAAVDIKVLLELLAIGILITLISGSSAMISIQRFSPLTILKERT